MFLEGTPTNKLKLQHRCGGVVDPVASVPGTKYSILRTPPTVPNVAAATEAMQQARLCLARRVAGLVCGHQKHRRRMTSTRPILATHWRAWHLTRRGPGLLSHTCSLDQLDRELLLTWKANHPMSQLQALAVPCCKSAPLHRSIPIR